jgi:hypothetical protein
MDVWVPFKVSPKGMEDHDNPRGVVHGLVYFPEHAQDNTVGGVEQAVKEGTFLHEKAAQVFVNGKNTMPVVDVNEFEGHLSGAFHGIFVAASRTETAVAAERDKFQFTTIRATVHCPAIGWITTVYHLANIFHHTVTWMEGVIDFFIIVSENLL